MAKKQAQPILQADESEFLSNAPDFLDKCIGYGTAVFLFILPFLLHARLYDGSFAVKRAALEIAVPFLLCLCALRLFLNQKTVVIKVTWLSLGIIAFVIWHWFSLFWSYHLFEAYLSVLRWTASILPFFLLAACKRRSRWIQLWLGTLIAASIAVSLLGICQTLFLSLKVPFPDKKIMPFENLLLPFERYTGSSLNLLWSISKPMWFLNKILWAFYKFLGQAAAPSATFINRNFAMHFVNFMLPISFIWIWRAVKPASITFGLIAVTLHCIYIFRAGSRAALVAFAVMFVCLTAVMIINSSHNYSLFRINIKRLIKPAITTGFIVGLIGLLYLFELDPGLFIFGLMLLGISFAITIIIGWCLNSWWIKIPFKCLAGPTIIITLLMGCVGISYFLSETWITTHLPREWGITFLYDSWRITFSPESWITTFLPEKCHIAYLPQQGYEALISFCIFLFCLAIIIGIKIYFKASGMIPSLKLSTRLVFNFTLSLIIVCCAYFTRPAFIDKLDDAIISWLMLLFFVMLLACSLFFNLKIFNPLTERITGFLIIIVGIIGFSLFIPTVLDNSSIADKFRSLFSTSTSTAEVEPAKKLLPLAEDSPLEPKAEDKDSVDKPELVEEEFSFKGLLQEIRQLLEQKAKHEPRFAMLINSLGIILDYPLRGVGTGNFRTYYPKYQGFGVTNRHLALGSRPEHVHNDYIQMFGELGIIGLAIFLLILCTVFWNIATMISSKRFNSRNRLIVIGIGTALAGLFVVMMFSFPMDRVVPPLLLFLSLGILDVLYRREKPEDTQKITAIPAVSYGFIALFLICATALMCYENSRNLKYAALQQNMLEYEKLTKWKEIIPDGVDATRIYPNASRHLFYLGRAYAETGDLVNASKMMVRSIIFDPYSAVSQTNYGVILGRRAMLIEASRELGKSVELTPDFVLGRVNYGFSLIKINKIEEGLAEFRKAVELDNTDHYAHMHLAKTLKDLGRMDESLQVYLDSAKYCKGNPLAQYEAGRELAERKRIQEAIPYYKKSVDLNPMSIKICFELAKLYEITGKPDWSRQLYVHILKNIAPRDKKTMQALSDLMGRAKKAQEAAKAEAAKAEPAAQ